MIRFYSNNLKLFAFLFILSLCLSRIAAGNDFSATPFVNLRSEYNDNLFNSIENKTEDTMTNISSGIKLLKSEESWNASLSAEAVVKAYAENSELDNIDKNFRTELMNRLSERITGRLNAEFTADSRNDRDFEETGMIDGQGRLKAEKVIRKDTDIGLSASYDLSEITATTLRYNLTLNSFDDREYSDYTSHTLSIRLDRRLSGPMPDTRFFAQTNYYRYQSLNEPLNDPVYGTDFQKKITMNSLLLFAGVRANINEKLTLRIQLGGGYNDSGSVSRVSGRKVAKAENKGWAQGGEISLRQTNEKNAWETSLRHDIRPRTGNGSFVRNTALRFNYSHRFTENFRVAIQSGYYLNRSYHSLDSEKIDENTIRFQPNLIYFLTKAISVECQYRYDNIKNRRDNTDIERNRIMVGISYRYPGNMQ